MRDAIIDSPTNGTTGQHCGTFGRDELPSRIREAIDADPEAGEWPLPALSDGDEGEPLADLTTIVREAPADAPDRPPPRPGRPRSGRPRLSDRNTVRKQPAVPPADETELEALTTEWTEPGRRRTGRPRPGGGSGASGGS